MRTATKQNNIKTDIRLSFLVWFSCLLNYPLEDENKKTHRHFTLLNGSDDTWHSSEGTDWSCYVIVAIVLWHILQRTVVSSIWLMPCFVFFSEVILLSGPLFHYLPPFWTDVNSVRTMVGWLISLGSLWLSGRGGVSLLHVNTACF